MLNQTNKKMKKSKQYNELTVVRYENGEPVEFTLNRTVSLTDEEAKTLNLHKLKGSNIIYVAAESSTPHEVVNIETKAIKEPIAKPKPVAAKRVKKQPTA